MNYPDFKYEMKLELLSYFQPSQINIDVENNMVLWVFIELSVGLSLLLSNATPGTFSIFSSTMPDDVRLVVCHIVNKAFYDALRTIHNKESA